MLTLKEVSFSAADINKRVIVRAPDSARKMLTFQNQDAVAIFKVSPYQKGAARIVWPGQEVMWDVYASSDAIYVECDTAGAILLIEEGY